MFSPPGYGHLLLRVDVKGNRPVRLDGWQRQSEPRGLEHLACPFASALGSRIGPAEKFVSSRAKRCLCPRAVGGSPFPEPDCLKGCEAQTRAEPGQQPLRAPSAHWCKQAFVGLRQLMCSSCVSIRERSWQRAGPAEVSSCVPVRERLCLLGPPSYRKGGESVPAENVSRVTVRERLCQRAAKAELVPRPCASRVAVREHSGQEDGASEVCLA